MYRRITVLFMVTGLLFLGLPAHAGTPDGETGPWADSVDSSAQGLRRDGSAVPANRSATANALGPAEMDDSSFYSLGFGGSITLQFANDICNGEGDDLEIVEVTNLPYPNETADIFVSDDGTTFVFAGSVTRDGMVSLPVGIDVAHYVRVVDTSDPALFTTADPRADAYDVDGVQALHTDCPPPASGHLAGMKYYDGNANGQFDVGESGIGDWPITINDTTVVTDTDGTFTQDADAGTYDVTEVRAADPWRQSGNVFDQTTGTGSATLTDYAYEVELDEGESVEGLYFGNLCVGAGGGKTKGFWTNKNGQAEFEEDSAGALAVLQDLNLRNEDGSHFDPESYSEVKTWLKKARAVNQAYMLSAQLAAMALNVHFELVDPEAMIDATGTSVANDAGYATVADVMDAADDSLAGNGDTRSGPERPVQAALSAALDAANNNKSFVQGEAGDCPTPVFPA